MSSNSLSLPKHAGDDDKEHSVLRTQSADPKLDENENLSHYDKSDDSAIYEGNDTPLISAVKTAALETVKLLLKSGADVNLATPKGWTPLHFAAKHGTLPIACLVVLR